MGWREECSRVRDLWANREGVCGSRVLVAGMER